MKIENHLLPSFVVQCQWAVSDTFSSHKSVSVQHDYIQEACVPGACLHMEYVYEAFIYPNALIGTSLLILIGNEDEFFYNLS